MGGEVDRLVRHIPEEIAHLGHWQPMARGTAPVEIALVFRIQHQEEMERKMEQAQCVFSDEEFRQNYGISDALRIRARHWLIQSGLKVTQQDTLTLWARGSFDAVAHAFQLDFEETYHRGRRKFHPRQDPTLPDWLSPFVLSVVGLDNIGELHPKYRQVTEGLEAANDQQGFFPNNIQSAYSVPSTLDGTGITIGILEFSNGYAEDDIKAFWSSFSIPRPTVEFVSVDGTPNDGGTSSQDLECTLDVEWAGAIAPGATLVVYEASAGSSDQAFGLSVLKNLRYVLNDSAHQPSVATISYGDGETRFAPATMEAWDSTILEMNAKGITVFVASGDQGAYGLHGVGLPIRHVDAPANCPHAVAVGGTHLVLDRQGHITEETGWTETNDNGASGGGVSRVFSLPSYQASVSFLTETSGSSGRGVPDVALNADPDTGYAVVFQGAATVVGGTSVGSPIWAAFTALLNQHRANQGMAPIGSLIHRIYQRAATNPALFRDITVGNNNYFGVVGYDCQPGWDAVTGFGSPNLSQWIQSLT